PVVRDPRAREPVAPEARGRADPCRRLPDVLGRGELLGPGQSAIQLRACLEHVAAPNPVALDAEGEIGREADRQARPGCIGHVLAALDQLPLGRRAAVVEDRFADKLDLDGPIQALERPDEHVVAVVVGRWARVWSDLVWPTAWAHGE